MKPKEYVFLSSVCFSKLREKRPKVLIIIPDPVDFSKIKTFHFKVIRVPKKRNPRREDTIPSINRIMLTLQHPKP